MVLSVLLLALSFVMLLAGAFIFTNAVEWAGVRLNLGQGAVGSILAAVATAMPESLIPVVAIISGAEGGEIAVGSILGAPFLLATLGMAVCGIAALAFRGRREHMEPRLDRHTMVHDLLYFLGAFAVVVALGLVDSKPAHIAGAVAVLVAYAVYTWRTIARGKEQGSEQEQPAALFFDPSKQDPPRGFQIILQLLLGIALLVGGAELFVSEVEHIAKEIGIPALILALVLAPLASELPEKLNSVLWIREGKDTLALGNISGAMVFQTTIPVSVGLIFTDWKLTAPSLVACGAALAGAALALPTVLRGHRFTMPLVAAWLVLYAGAVAAIILLR